jgi:exopolyphosphatase/pppGpp-phosphohydrolase
MLLGVLDIGSNSAQLQVVEARPGAPPLPTHSVKEPTMLGGAFAPDGSIDDAGADRVVLAVYRAMDAARRLGVEQLYVFTTSRLPARRPAQPLRPPFCERQRPGSLDPPSPGRWSPGPP